MPLLRRARRSRRFAVLTALAATASTVACGGGDGPTPPPSGSITVSAAPLAVTVGASASTTVVVSVARTGSFSGAVALAVSGAPAGVTATLAAASLPAGTTATTLTIAATSAAAPGSYPLTMTATGTGVTTQTAIVTLTVPQPTIGLALDTGAVTIAPGGSGTVTAALTRGGGFTGDIQLDATGAPAGVTVAFTPNPVPGSTASAVITLTAGAGATAGTTTVTIRASGTGVAEQTATLSVTVSPVPTTTLSASQAALTVARGQAASTTLTLARASFAGSVSFAASGLPAGVSAAFDPPSTTGTTSVLTLSTTAAAAVGTYPITVTASSTGIANATASVTLVVVSSANTVRWRFCNAQRVPLWFAVRDGASGGWTRVSPGADTSFTFTLTQAIGGVALVRPGDAGTAVTGEVYLYDRAQLQAVGAAACVDAPATRSVRGTAAGLGAGQAAFVGLGGGSATLEFPGTAWEVANVPERPVDLLAARVTRNLATFTITPDRFVLRRTLAPPTGAVLPVIDFTDAEAFAPTTATYTFEGVGGSDLITATEFVTANGTTGTFYFGPLLGGSATRTIYGIPSARTQPGDLHQVLAFAGGQAAGRIVQQANRELSARTLSFGSDLATVAVTSLGATPYGRLRAAGSWQAEYGGAVGVTFSQSANGGRVWTLITARAHAGAEATAYELVLPDFSGVTGFSTAWGLAGGAPTDWRLTAITLPTGVPGAPVEGASWRAAYRSGTATP